MNHSFKKIIKIKIYDYKRISDKNKIHDTNHI